MLSKETRNKASMRLARCGDLALFVCSVHFLFLGSRVRDAWEGVNGASTARNGEDEPTPHRPGAVETVLWGIEFSASSRVIRKAASVAAGKHAAVAPRLGAARKLLSLWRVARCRGVVHGKSHTAPSRVVHVLRFLGRAQVHLPVIDARRQPHPVSLPSRTGARGKRSAPRAARREQTLRRGDRTAAIERRRHGTHSGPSSWRQG